MSSLAWAIFLSAFPLAGIISGIIALFGVRRYGRKGILLPALSGIGIWLLLFVMALPVFLRAKQRASAVVVTSLASLQHISNSKRIVDDELSFSFDIPEEFLPSLPPDSPKGCRHFFIKLGNGEPNSVLFVKPLGGTLPHKHLKAEDIPPGKAATLTPFLWRGLEVDGIRIPENIGGVDYLTFVVQIPLRKEAIQFSFGGPEQSEPQLREFAEHVLLSLDGETNW